MLRSGNEYVGLEIATRVDPAAEAWISSIETVSSSEAGFERVYQGSALVFAWPLDLRARRLRDRPGAACGDHVPRPAAEEEGQASR